jgi:hypothetical protein
MLGDNHLHIDRDDQLSDLMSKAAKCATGGALSINFAGEQAVRIVADNGRIAIDILQGGIFKVPEDESSLFDKLKTASEFGRKLSDNDVTLSFMRKGKEAVRLGKDARPTLSRLISGSNDIQLTNIKEFAKLKDDLKTD